MTFKCPSCESQLKIEPEMAGKSFVAPAAIQIPADPGGGLPPPSGLPVLRVRQLPPDASAERHLRASVRTGTDLQPAARASRCSRSAWRLGRNRSHQSEPSSRLRHRLPGLPGLDWVLFPFKAPEGTAPATYTAMQFIASLFFKHALVSFTNTLFFTWSMAIIYLKLKKLNHQKKARRRCAALGAWLGDQSRQRGHLH